MISNKTKVTFETTITLTEAEARALDALAGYGVDQFIDAFYKQMGKHYISPHESGLRTLLARIRSEVVPQLSLVDAARAKLKEPS